ncbi:MAG: hydrogenase maturation nickel metallochaperone HypA [Propionibacteriaceae bacterium]|nr:hydrogenase maturation nickel metallochaperone HypA [Propionibacteriaceae bacterium]
MHELALCRSIATIAERAADGKKVAVVELDVGQLRQVVPETLTYCWSIVSQATPLDGSRLDIRYLPGTLSCRDCGAQTQLAGLAILKCATCASASVDVVSGEEFIVRSLVLEDSDGTVPPP